MDIWMSNDEWIHTTIEKLIAQFHTDLAEAKFGVKFREKAGTNKNGKVMARTKKISKSQQIMGVPYDFVIEIGNDIWNGLTDEQKISLLDHEISHCVCVVDEESSNKSYSLVPHDLEEFRAIVERHGFWLEDVKKFADTCKAVVE